MYYLIKTTENYRVPTVEDALKLREWLEKNHDGELISFKYVLKQLKAKGEVCEEYQAVTATFLVDNEKEPKGTHLIYVKENSEE